MKELDKELDDLDQWVLFCEQATDRQLANIIEKETTAGRFVEAKLAKIIQSSRA